MNNNISSTHTSRITSIMVTNSIEFIFRHFFLSDKALINIIWMLAHFYPPKCNIVYKHLDEATQKTTNKTYRPSVGDCKDSMIVLVDVRGIF